MLRYKTTWAIIPDVIDGSEVENDRLLFRWPFERKQGAPVWHLHESLERMVTLCNGRWPRVCFGSSGEYSVIGTPRWSNRVAEAFNALVGAYKEVPVWIHMLRGMSLAGSIFPFASLDSTDVAQNWHRKGDPVERADYWDRVQCPATWEILPTQEAMKYPPIIAVEGK